MKNIYIVYSQSQNEIFSMWNSFFESCGIWVMAQTGEQKKRNTVWKEKESVPSLYILDENDQDLIASEKRENRIYMVSPAVYTLQMQCRSDIYQIQWKDVKIFTDMLQALDTEARNNMLGEVLIDFLKLQLWGHFWLFSEIVLEVGDAWNKKIAEQCRRLITLVNEQKEKALNQYYAYLRIYCEYVVASLEVMDMNAQLECVNRLLKMCMEFADKFGGNAALDHLAGHICGISAVEARTAVVYYEHIEDEKRTPELLYLIGREYEKKYRNEEKALEFYKESYRKNHNYRASYKIAVYCREEDWKQKLAIYEDILHAVRKEYKYDAITIRNLEYEYKVTLRIAEIYKEYLGAGELVLEAKRYLKHLFDGIEQRTDFNDLLRKMFGNSAAEVTAQLLKKIKKRFQTVCFSNSILEG